METYLIDVIEDLVVTAIVCGVVYAYARSRWQDRGTRTITVAMLAGLVAAAVMAYFKQNTSLIATGNWNFVIYAVSLVLFVVVVVCLAVADGAARRAAAGSAATGGADEGGADAGPGAPAAASTAAAAPAAGSTVPEAVGDEPVLARRLRLVALYGLAAIVFLRVFYSVPDVINYPANFGISSDNIISSDFAVRIVGWLMGIAVVMLVYLAVQKSFRALGSRLIGIACAVILAVMCFVQTMTLLQIMIARRIIVRGTPAYQVLFPLTSWVSNNDALFTLAAMVITIVLGGIIVWMSLQDKEPYANPAQHRRNKARWRNRRRWVICLIACLAFSFVTITAVKAYAERGPEIVESEECLVDDEGIHISLDQVSDGHLHRFTYTTDAGYTTSSGYVTKGGIGVRVIVIKKPNSNAYGVGLDACDICGTTGYYERDGQVVCSKCDVVMNINTIGFKGGCNPIVIDYTVKDGYINIAKESLDEYEKIPGAVW